MTLEYCSPLSRPKFNSSTRPCHFLLRTLLRTLLTPNLAHSHSTYPSPRALLCYCPSVAHPRRHSDCVPPTKDVLPNPHLILGMRWIGCCSDSELKVRLARALLAEEVVASIGWSITTSRPSPDVLKPLRTMDSHEVGGHLLIL